MRESREPKLSIKLEEGGREGGREGEGRREGGRDRGEEMEGGKEGGRGEKRGREGWRERGGRGFKACKKTLYHTSRYTVESLYEAQNTHHFCFSGSSKCSGIFNSQLSICMWNNY